MKLKIKVKRINKSIPFSKVISKGDWIDLRAAETITLNAPQAGTLKRRIVNGVERSYRNVVFDSKLIKLGVAIQLPKGFEAVVLSRSSTYKNFGVILGNSEGVIDQSYCGDNDEWKFPVLATRRATIPKGERICQFRIVANQPQLILSEVEHLHNADRGGFGSTGRR